MRFPRDITILALYDRISIFHTLSPWLLGLHKDTWDGAPPRITFTDDPTWCLTRDRNEHLIMVRRFLKPPVTDTGLLERLRARYRRIFFLNGNAGGGIHRPEVLPYVDRFYNKAVFRDRSLYGRSLYGGELFSDYYHRAFNIDDDPDRTPPIVPEPDIGRIHTHWNIGVGDFPRRKYVQRAGVAIARAPAGGPRWSIPIIHRSFLLKPSPYPVIRESDYRFDVNARIGPPGYPTIAFHRTHLKRVLLETAEQEGWRVAIDRVPPRRFFRDMQMSRITFSPFGWGELCFRDFEAIRAGSLLLKPDMAHIETFPDVFLPGKTYVPVKWDGSDLADRILYYLNHESKRREIVRAAHERLRSELAALSARSTGVLVDLLERDD